MQIIQSRRDFLASASAAAAAGVLGARSDRSPTRRRRRRPRFGSAMTPGHLHRAEYVAEELLRAEGFTDIRYVRAVGSSYAEA